MDRAELIRVCDRLLSDRPKRGEDVRVCALALQRFLISANRKASFDKRGYQREYMRRYRLRRR